MSDVKIQIRPNGPFLVTGPVTLLDPAGNAYDLTGKESIALCRCGESKKKPFCDGTHKTCGFDAMETVPPPPSPSPSSQE
ncbi:MAG: CDGSH iron-sulfur domain-containing protein [Planctomycetaceae bacterium]